MDVMLIKAGQFMLGLTILVGIHELGHMLFAKLFGMRVEKFSIGFGPVLFWFQGKETKYQFSLLPLGGFVKISGMVDESLDTANLEQKPESWEFRGKPTWQRLLVMLGGIIFNIILGIIIFSSLIYKYGMPYTDLSKLEHGFLVGEYAKEIGLQNGDYILKVNGEDVEKQYDITEKLVKESNSITILRDSQEQEIKLPEDFLANFLKLQDERKFFIMPDAKFYVGQIVQNSKADSAGLQSDDIFVQVESDSIKLFSDLKESLTKHKNDSINFSVKRGEDTLVMHAVLDSTGKLGFGPVLADTAWSMREFYGMGGSIGIGTQSAFLQFYANFIGIGKVISGDIPLSNMKGIAGMSDMYGEEFKPSWFWTVCGVLSMALALMNLLPIPGLDGGHVVFLLYEMVSGKKPSIKFQEIALKIGFLILISLMLFVNGNEIFNLLR